MTVSTPLLEVDDLVVEYPVRSTGLLRRKVGALRAVDHASFSIARRQTLGLVGESGSGKTTTARAIVGLVRPTAGSIRLDGKNAESLLREGMAFRSRVQIVFQDSNSLDPRMRVSELVDEPLAIRSVPRGERDRRVAEVLGLVGIGRELRNRFPHALSGGQRQRVGIARALAVNPELLILDEPIASLDVSIQGQILNLLLELQKEFGLTYLLIAHDLTAVRALATSVSVMYHGRIVEQGEVEELFARPVHPYTRALLSAVPMPDPALERSRSRIVPKGDQEGPTFSTSGCVFAARCPFVNEACLVASPRLSPLDGQHLVEYCCDACTPTTGDRDVKSALSMTARGG